MEFGAKFARNMQTSTVITCAQQSKKGTKKTQNNFPAI